MTETTLSYRSEIAAPAADVLRWHSSPGAFERLTPPWMDVRVLDGSGGIEPDHWKRLRVGAGPLGVPWTLVHHAVDDGTGFVDEQTDGPFASWRHEHRFSSDGPERSVLEDRITYQLPFGSVGQLVAGGQFERRLNDLFRFRHARTKLDLARHAAAGLVRPQRIAISGASGLIGSQLVPFLRTGGHDVARLVRAATERGRRDRLGSGQRPDRRRLTRRDGCGNPPRRRLDRRRTLDHSPEGGHPQQPAAGDEPVGGNSGPPAAPAARADLRVGHRLLRRCREHSLDRGIAAGRLASWPDVCRAWEEATAPAAASGIRVVLPRFGVVLSGRGGLLARLLPPFRFGVGGPLGSGEQFMSWIALDDLLGVLLRAIADDRLAGPVNAVAPHAVSNRVFAETLGRVLSRPAVLRTPARALRLVAGELADELLLASQLARPARLEEVGFSFAFPTLEDALRHELGRSGGNRGAEIPATSLRSAVQPGHSR